MRDLKTCEMHGFLTTVGIKYLTTLLQFGMLKVP